MEHSVVVLAVIAVVHLIPTVHRHTPHLDMETNRAKLAEKVLSWARDELKLTKGVFECITLTVELLYVVGQR